MLDAPTGHGRHHQQFLVQSVFTHRCMSPVSLSCSTATNESLLTLWSKCSVGFVALAFALVGRLVCHSCIAFVCDASDRSLQCDIIDATSVLQ